MKPLTAIFVVLCSIFIAGCAGMTAPSAQDMSQIPVVHFGDSAPVDKPFVIHYPAGASLPVDASVNGDLLDKSDAATLHVTLKRDVYVYKQWVSLDGKNWQRGNELVTGKFEMRIPGTQDGKDPGVLHAEFNLK